MTPIVMLRSITDRRTEVGDMEFPIYYSKQSSAVREKTFCSKIQIPTHIIFFSLLVMSSSCLAAVQLCYIVIHTRPPKGLKNNLISISAQGW